MRYYAGVDLGGTNTKINNILYYTQNLINEDRECSFLFSPTKLN